MGDRTIGRRKLHMRAVSMPAKSGKDLPILGIVYRVLSDLPLEVGKTGSVRYSQSAIRGNPGFC